MRKRMVIGILLFSLSAVLFAQGTAEQKSVELLVSAAASTTDCMQELGTLFAEKNAGVDVVFNFGSSGALQQQIEQGAPVDVFLSAGQKQMKALVDKHLMDDVTVRDLLENKVVLITQLGSPTLSSFNDLTQQGIVRIGVGDPKSVPAGQYARQVFDALGLSEQLSSKFVYAKDVREVLSWVETGNVDAGVVYETDSKISEKVQVDAYAPEGTHTPVTYPVGVLKDGKHAALARSFVEFLFTDEAKSIFVSYGFTVL